MVRTELDHLVVMAATLEAGVVWVRERLGVIVPLGGKHDKMATHNAVMALGSGVYFEIIAIDPEAPPPTKPRWFAFDDPTFRERLERDSPRLAHWVVRSNDIDATLAKACVNLGVATAMSRGDLHWQIAIRPDGRLLEGGLIPTVIEWPTGPHPSERMSDLDVRLKQLTLRHPEPRRLADMLRSLHADGFVDIEPSSQGEPAIEARFSGPLGETILS